MAQYEVVTDAEGYDLRFRHPASYMVCGNSQAGKTTWVLNVLRQSKELFQNPKCMQNVIYFYNLWQDKFDHADREGLVTEWIDEVPTKEIILEKTKDYKRDGGSVIVVDDQVSNLKSNMVEIYTVLTHHLSCATFLLSQSLFPKVEAFRDISKNCTYNVVFKTTRDFRQFRTLAQQIQPLHWRYLVDVYEKECVRPYSYLLLDYDHRTPPLLQVRNNVLASEGDMAIFRRKK